VALTPSKLLRAQLVETRVYELQLPLGAERARLEGGLHGESVDEPDQRGRWMAETLRPRRRVGC
jgi:hypothetical protein